MRQQIVDYLATTAEFALVQEIKKKVLSDLSKRYFFYTFETPLTDAALDTFLMCFKSEFGINGDITANRVLVDLMQLL